MYKANQTQEQPKQIQNNVQNIYKNILVVGVNSQIGSELFKKLKQELYNVFGTTRNVEKNEGDFFYFDLLKPDFDADLTKYDCVIICAGITNIEQCESDPDTCKKINSINTIALIDKCVESNCFVIFLSSNAVFDGKKPFYKHTDTTGPVSRYGEYKLTVEQYIKDLPSNSACVLRLTKVITNNTPFIQNWRSSAESGKLLEAFTNRFISPVDIKDVIESIILLINHKQSGIFQLGGSENISFYEYAKKIYSSDIDILNKIVGILSVGPERYCYDSMLTHLPEKKS